VFANDWNKKNSKPLKNSNENAQILTAKWLTIPILFVLLPLSKGVPITAENKPIEPEQVMLLRDVQTVSKAVGDI
jgi:hypothetical protein